MKRTVIASIVLLVLAGVVLVLPAGGPQSQPEAVPLPPSEITITLDDPGDVAAIKFAALYMESLGREAASFAPRVRANPTSGEFAGPGPAANSWRTIAQDVQIAAQTGLSNKIFDIQEKEQGWSTAADYLEQAGQGWTAAAQRLHELSRKR